MPRTKKLADFRRHLGRKEWDPAARMVRECGIPLLGVGGDGEELRRWLANGHWPDATPESVAREWNATAQAE